MQPQHLIFEISDLNVRYGLRQAVQGLSLALAPGRSLGVLGLNGAGKTSTIKVLLGMLRPRHGHVSVLGGKPGALTTFRRIGFAPEEGLPPEYLTGREYLNFVASVRLKRADGKSEVELALRDFEIPEKKRVRDYSKGMKRKLVLAQAFMGRPDFLILDEPLNGLDPLFILKLRERIEVYLANGGSLLLSSHILTEVERTCTDVAILHAGKLICHAPVAGLVGEFGSVEKAFAAKVGNQIV